MDLSSFIRYLQFEKRYSAHTIVAYQKDIEQFFEFIQQQFQSNNWSQVKSIHLRSWVVQMMRDEVKASSIHRKVSALKTYHKFLLITKVIHGKSFPHVLLPKKPERLPEYVEVSKLNKLQNEVYFEEGYAGMRDYLMLEILYNTGMRRTELIHLSWNDVDHEKQTLKVLGKGKKVRLIPVSKELLSDLKVLLAIEEESFETKEGRVLLTDKGNKMYPKFVYNKVKKYLSLVTTAEKKSPHVLRHSFATHLSNNGADLNAIKELLGHANLAATQVYTHNSIEQLKKIYDKAHPKAKKS